MKKDRRGHGSEGDAAGVDAQRRELLRMALAGSVMGGLGLQASVGQAQLPPAAKGGGLVFADGFELRARPPAWMASIPVGQIGAIANTAPAAYTDAVNGFTSSGNILNAFSGFHIVGAAKVRLFGGGHNDYSGNEVLDLDLAADTPALRTFCAPTPLGSRVPAVVWQGTPPDARMNVPHTYDSGIWSPALGRSLWFGQSSPWNAGGTLPGGGQTFSLIEATARWAQPGSADDLGPAPGGVCAARDNAGNLYGCSFQRVHRYTPGSGWSEFVNNGALAWNRFGALLYDSRRNRLLRIGDLGAARYFTIDCTSAAVVNLASLLTGSAADLALLNARTSVDTTGGDYNPDLDAFVIPVGLGAEMLLINASTWAVSRMTPPAASGSVPNASGYPGLGVWGRIKYVPDLGGMAYWPTGNGNLWFWRTRS